MYSNTGSTGLKTILKAMNKRIFFKTNGYTKTFLLLFKTTNLELFNDFTSLEFPIRIHSYSLVKSDFVFN